MYEIVFTSRASREFKKLAPPLQERLSTAIERFATNPRQTGVKKLTETVYRIRVGDWRVIYAIMDRQRRVVIVKIVRRSKDTYANLDELF